MHHTHTHTHTHTHKHTHTHTHTHPINIPRTTSDKEAYFDDLRAFFYRPSSFRINLSCVLILFCSVLAVIFVSESFITSNRPTHEKKKNGNKNKQTNKNKTLQQHTHVYTLMG